MHLIRPEHEYKENVYFDEKFSVVNNSVSMVCDRLKREGYVTEWEIKENNYVNYKAHNVVIEIGTKKRQLKITLWLEPVFVWFDDKPLFNTYLARMLMHFYEKVKTSFDKVHPYYDNPNMSIILPEKKVIWTANAQGQQTQALPNQQPPKKPAHHYPYRRA